MSKATVTLVGSISFTAHVEVPDSVDEDERDEVAIEAAYDMLPGLCAQCSGWGKRWSKDESTYEPLEGDSAVEWEGSK